MEYLLDATHVGESLLLLVKKRSNKHLILESRTLALNFGRYVFFYFVISYILLAGKCNLYELTRTLMDDPKANTNDFNIDLF